MFVLVLAARVVAADELPQARTADRPLAPAGERLSPPPSAAVSADHPLTPILAFARQEQKFLRETLRDFSCRLVKRERIDGFLQDFQYIDMWVREEVRQDNRVAQPMSIYLQFLAPAKVSGRQVLFIEGENDGKMLVRNGGKHFDYVVVNIDPDGDSARDESLVPITQSGFNRVLGQMIAVLEKHVRADPSGANTRVERIAGARLNKRPSSVIRVTHPQKQRGLEFHVANVFVDDELRVPVRVDFSLWPSRPGQTPPLLAEYTYTQLKLNPNLPDNTFSPGRLRGSR